MLEMIVFPFRDGEAMKKDKVTEAPMFKPRIHMHLGEKGIPKHLKVGKKAHARVHGKVVGMHQDDQGSSVEMEDPEVEFGGGESDTLGHAIKTARRIPMDDDE